MYPRGVAPRTGRPFAARTLSVAGVMYSFN